MYQLPYSSNLDAEVVFFFFFNLVDFKLHTESMQLQLHEKKKLYTVYYRVNDLNPRVIVIKS